MSPENLDRTDLKILDALQKDGRLTNALLAEKVGLSLSPCWRRLKRLEESGIIAGYQAIINRKALGLSVTAFVRIDIERHTPAQERRFEEAIADLPEIVSCHVISGEGAFLLTVVCESLEAYSKIRARYPDGATQRQGHADQFFAQGSQGFFDPADQAAGRTLTACPQAANHHSSFKPSTSQGSRH